MLCGGVLVTHPSASKIPINLMCAEANVLSAVKGVLPEERHAKETAPKVLPPGQLGTVVRSIKRDTEFTSKVGETFTPDNPKLTKLLGEGTCRAISANAVLKKVLK
eukprot:5924306-Amphidinium_carterae.1